LRLRATEGADRDPSTGAQAPEVAGICRPFTRPPPLVSGTVSVVAAGGRQRQVNDLMDKHGCHTCGTKNPGTKSGDAVADHQPPQALDEPEIFLPHCNHCNHCKLVKAAKYCKS
jgi:hypothetical protein